MRFGCLFLAFVELVSAQRLITTFAGTDWVFRGDGKPAVDAPLGNTTGITTDPAGNPVFVDIQNCTIDRINPDGTLTVIAGTACFVVDGTGATGDGGPAIHAVLRSPFAVAYDNLGNLYVTGLNNVRKISPSGIITTIMTPAPTQLAGVAADASGNVYFSETANDRVRKVTTTGAVLTVAGQDSGVSGSTGDGGPALSATLAHPDALAVDNGGVLYIGDGANFRIRKVALNGTISTVVTGIAPHGIAFDRAGNLYVGGNYAVYRFPAGTLPLAAGATLPPPIAGSALTPGFAGDGGPATKALFGGPLGVAVDSRGNVYVADWGSARVRKISTDGTITTAAGNGRFRATPSGVRAIDAPLNTPGPMALDADGNLFVAQGNGVSRIDRNGILTAFAGTGQIGNTGDGGPATLATFRAPTGLAVDSGGNLYIADVGSNAIRKVNRAGIISTFLVYPDGPRSLAFDGRGNLYILGNDARVRIMDPAGKMTVYAGGGPGPGPGDGGPAVAAVFESPRDLLLGPTGNLYISEAGGNRVRMVNSQGIISTVAGIGTPGRDGNGGPAVKALLNNPTSLAMDASGALYITDVNNIVVRRVSPDGIISTFAGGGPYDQLSDGKPATEAVLYSPSGLAVDAAGDVFIGDAGSGVLGSRIREVLAAPPTMQVAPAQLSLTAASGGAPVRQTITVTGSISGIQFNVKIGSTIPANWLTADSASDVSPRLLTLTADPGSLPPGDYTAQVTITPVGATPAALNLAVSFKVGPTLSPVLSVDQPALSFTLPSGAPARSSTLQVSNSGGQILAYTATIKLAGGGNWLAVSPTSGSVSPGQPKTLTVTANPAGLSVGTYTGQITIEGAGNAGTKTIPVAVSISSNRQAVLLTQSGLSFTAVAAGGVVPPQSFGVINAGTGVMNWTAGVSTTDHANWLHVSPSSGSTDLTAPAPQVTVTVTAAGLSAGQYYGTVRIDAPGTANGSRVITVFLRVLPADSSPPAAVQPSELVFYARSGGAAPGSQVLRLYNISAKERRFTSARSSGGFLLFVLPDSGVLDPNEPSQVIVQPAGNFAAGTYIGALTFQFSDGTVQSVKTTVVSSDSAVLPQTANTASRVRTLDAGSCTPGKPNIALKSLGSGFQVSAGWPVGLSVDVSDECKPWVAGSVVATFDNGDDQVVLTPLGNGTWQGTWRPRQIPSAVAITITAQNGTIQNSSVLTGALAPPNDQPMISPTSINTVWALPSTGPRPLAPGTFLEIYAAGSARLADFESTALPTLPKQLAHTVVLFDNVPAPIFYASATQLDVVVPSGVKSHATSQIWIQRGEALSDPVAVDIAAAEPTVLQTGGNAWLLGFKPDGSQFLVDQTTPASAGDLLLMYCVGLGATDLTVADGAISPGSAVAPAAKTPAVAVNIGGKDAAVYFAGLAPGFVGLYQINAYVPPGTATGSLVPLTVTVAGQTSPTVYLPVR